MALKYYKSVVKALNLKIPTFWGLIPTFVQVRGEKLLAGAFWFPSILIGLKDSFQSNILLSKMNIRLSTNATFIFYLSSSPCMLFLTEFG